MLIVEDEQIIALELQDRLSRMGHCVAASVASAEGAIDAAERLRPDLVLMDIMLQGRLDGIDAAALILRELDIPVVYLTAFADERTLERAKATEPYGYVLKPFHERELHAVIEVALYRHQIARQLKEAEAWRVALLRSAGDAVLAVGPNGRIKFMNVRAEGLTGWMEKDATGLELETVFKVIECPERRAPHWREESYKKLIAKDGAERPVEVESAPIRDSNGRALGFVWVFRDVSERKRLHDRQRFIAFLGRELSSSLDRETILGGVVRLIVRCAADWGVVHLADEKSGALRVASFAHARAEMAQILGADGEISETGLAADSHISVPLVVRGKSLGTLTLGLERSRRPFTEHDQPFAEEMGRILATALDNASLYAAAQRATRLREEVLSIVSHDLRSPLAAISLSADQMLRSPDKLSPERVLRNAQLITRNACRMDHLIGDLVDTARIDSGRLALDLLPHRVYHLMNEAAATFEAQAASRSITLCVESLPPEIEILCDGGRVLQVFSNLIENALKLSAEGATIRVRGAVNGPAIELEVSDEGGGIEPDQIPHIFDQHWQAPQELHRGTGLGLYIVRGIVEAHGGRISVDTEPGVGSTFRFTIPLAPSLQDRPAAPT